MELRRVVITGLGALTPIGNNIEEFWEGLRNGVSGSDWITNFDAEKFKTKFACEVKNFDAAEHFDRKELRKLDPFAQYAMVATEEAFQDADREELNKVIGERRVKIAMRHVADMTRENLPVTGRNERPESVVSKLQLTGAMVRDRYRVIFSGIPLLLTAKLNSGKVYHRQAAFRHQPGHRHIKQR